MDQRREKFLPIFCGIGLIALTVAVFYHVHAHEFINYDDNIYIVENPQVTNGLSWESVRWAFSSVHAGFWHPLTWLSHMLDCELFGLNPVGHHLTSLGIHVLNAILLFIVLLQMTRDIWPSAFVAALFAVHPLHVESVAWVAERKDVLSTMFWMLTTEAYILYVRNPSSRRYMGVVVFFILGLMSKPMLVTLPFVFLLLDVWPLRRVALTDTKNLRALAAEKIPLILLAVAFSAIAYLAQQKIGSLPPLDQIPMIQRVANAMVSAVTYMEQMFWPSGLVVFYPHPGSALTFRQIAGAGILLLAVTAVSIRLSEKIPYLFVGWFWYLITLAPVIGLVQVGTHGMADRYTYVPLIGLFFIVAWGTSDLIAKRPRLCLPLGIISIALIASLAVLSWKQAGHWKNSITLFEHVIRVMPDNWLAHTNFGIALQKNGDMEAGFRHFSEALSFNPTSSKTHYNLAVALDQVGMPAEAFNHYSQAVLYNPRLYKAHNNLGDLLSRRGRIDEAIRHYDEALRINPDHAAAHNNLGNVLEEKGRIPEAISHYLEAIRIFPKFVVAHYNLSKAYARAGNLEKSVEEVQMALALAEAAGDTRMADAIKKRLTAYQASLQNQNREEMSK